MPDPAYTGAARSRTRRALLAGVATAVLTLGATLSCAAVDRPNVEQPDVKPAQSASQAVAQPSSPTSIRDVARVVAFADVHGAHDELARLLQTVGVVDAQLTWSGGRTHLVATGDLLDRGTDSRKVLDLLMRLQREAAAAGGALHVVLGNHEAMNLLGDLRYVLPGEYAAYAADEPAGLREERRAAWIARNGAESGPAFDERFPPGYFGHRAAFAPDGVYGRWLLGLPAAIIINDTLYMHGGPSPVLAGLTLTEINLRYRTALTDYLGALAKLENAGLVRPEDEFAKRPQLARQRLAEPATRDAAATAALEAEVARFTAADVNPFLSSDGPNWSRGVALCNACIETDVLRPILAGLGAKRLVIGHTVTRDTRVGTRFDGTVIKLDTGMNRAAYKGHPAALVLEAGQTRVVYADTPAAPAAATPAPSSASSSTTAPGGAAMSAPVAEGLHVSSPDLDETTVAELLARGTVTVTGPRAPGVLDVAVESGGRRVAAVFIATTGEAIRKELAAERLDRLLGLGLVPATVEREVQGQRGVLQARPARWVTQADVQAQGLKGGGWCALPPQYELMYAFDALIGNEGRTLERILYDASAWMLMLTGHDRAFGTKKTLPAHLQQRPPQPGAELGRRLAALDQAGLDRALGAMIGARETRAILERRDAIVAAAPAAAAAGQPRN